jgi:hypothetical protein
MDPRTDLKRLLRQHNYLPCREPNKDFEATHLCRKIGYGTIKAAVSSGRVLG